MEKIRLKKLLLANQRISHSRERGFVVLHLLKNRKRVRNGALNFVPSPRRRVDGRGELLRLRVRNMTPRDRFREAAGEQESRGDATGADGGDGTHDFSFDERGRGIAVDQDQAPLVDHYVASLSSFSPTSFPSAVVASKGDGANCVLSAALALALARLASRPRAALSHAYRAHMKNTETIGNANKTTKKDTEMNAASSFGLPSATFLPAVLPTPSSAGEENACASCSGEDVVFGVPGG